MSNLTLHPAKEMPARVAKARRDQCARAGCSHPEAFFRDPCAACPVSGWGAYSGECGQVEAPSLLSMAVSFAGAVVGDLLAGRLRRSPEEVAEILRTHCEPCAQFMRESRRCAVCGCFLGRKAAMAGEHCPQGKW